MFNPSIELYPILLRSPYQKTKYYSSTISPFNVTIFRNTKLNHLSIKCIIRQIVKFGANELISLQVLCILLTSQYELSYLEICPYIILLTRYMRRGYFIFIAYNINTKGKKYNLTSLKKGASQSYSRRKYIGKMLIIWPKLVNRSNLLYRVPCVDWNDIHHILQYYHQQNICQQKNNMNSEIVEEKHNKSDKFENEIKRFIGSNHGNITTTLISIRWKADIVNQLGNHCPHNTNQRTNKRVNEAAIVTTNNLSDSVYRRIYKLNPIKDMTTVTCSRYFIESADQGSHIDHLNDSSNQESQHPLDEDVAMEEHKTLEPIRISPPVQEEGTIEPEYPKDMEEGEIDQINVAGPSKEFLDSLPEAPKSLRARRADEKMQRKRKEPIQEEANDFRFVIEDLHKSITLDMIIDTYAQIGEMNVEDTFIDSEKNPRIAHVHFYSKECFLKALKMKTNLGTSKEFDPNNPNHNTIQVFYKVMFRAINPENPSIDVLMEILPEVQSYLESLKHPIQLVGFDEPIRRNLFFAQVATPQDITRLTSMDTVVGQ